MNQRERLQALIVKFCNEMGSRTFSLKDLHEAHGDYSCIHIGGKTPAATVRRLLQELRDLKFISFLDKSGNYTLRGIDFLEKEKNDLRNIDLSRETPQKQEYLMETYVRNVRWAKLAKAAFGDTCLYKNCNNSFITENGSKYIEVHHIVPLFCGGENSIWNLSVLCAHHHRAAHFAKAAERKKIKNFLLKEVACRI